MIAKYMPAPGLLGSATCESAVGEEETGPGSCSQMPYTLSGNFMRPLRYMEDCRRS